MIGILTPPHYSGRLLLIFVAVMLMIATALMFSLPASASGPSAGPPPEPDYIEEDQDEESFVSMRVGLYTTLRFGVGTAGFNEAVRLPQQDSLYADLVLNPQRYYTRGAYEVLMGGWREDGLISDQVILLGTPMSAPRVFSEVMRTRGDWVFGPENCLAFRYLVSVQGDDGSRDDVLYRYTSTDEEVRYLFPAFLGDAMGSYPILKPSDIEDILDSVYWSQVNPQLRAMMYVGWAPQISEDGKNDSSPLYTGPPETLLDVYSFVHAKISFQVSVESILHGGCGFSKN